MGYTERRTTALLGLGVSAISETPDCYHQNEKVITVYERRVQQGEIPTLRGHLLSRRTIGARRDKILALMTTFRVRARRGRARRRARVPRAARRRRPRRRSTTASCASRATAAPFLRNVASFFDAHFRRASRPDRGIRPPYERRMSHVRVIGAGLSGLADGVVPREARRAAVDVVEAATRPGGLIQTHQLRRRSRRDGGARRSRGATRVAALFAGGRRRAPCPTRAESRRRYIFRDGRPRRWPLSPIGDDRRRGARGRPRGSDATVRAARRRNAWRAWGRAWLGPAATRLAARAGAAGHLRGAAGRAVGARRSSASRGRGAARSSRRAAAWASSSIGCTRSCARAA